MAKVITFSRKFPSYHPRAGEPTFFVEKVLNSLGFEWDDEDYLIGLYRLNKHNPKLSVDDIEKFFFSLGSMEDGCTEDFMKKPHTIRSGYRWKHGDMFSPRVWSGKPYNSPQIIFAPDQEVCETYSFSIGEAGMIHLEGCYVCNERSVYTDYFIKDVAKNDGLSLEDFKSWFKYPKPFEGQVISWKDPKY